MPPTANTPKLQIWRGPIQEKGPREKEKGGSTLWPKANHDTHQPAPAPEAPTPAEPRSGPQLGGHSAPEPRIFCPLYCQQDARLQHISVKK